MSTDRVSTRLRVIRNESADGEHRASRVRKMQREADRIHELEAEFRREQRARIRMEALAQRHGAPGWEIDRARTGGGL